MASRGARCRADFIRCSRGRGRRPRLPRCTSLDAVCRPDRSGPRRCRSASEPPIPSSAMPGRPFISPMGEPFRPRASRRRHAARWFRQADGNRDGFLTPAEMQADADRFFALLDSDRDGEIDPDELIAYEWEVAPDIQVNPQGGDPRRSRHRASPRRTTLNRKPPAPQRFTMAAIDEPARRRPLCSAQHAGAGCRGGLQLQSCDQPLEFRQRGAGAVSSCSTAPAGLADPRQACNRCEPPAPKPLLPKRDEKDAARRRHPASSARLAPHPVVRARRDPHAEARPGPRSAGSGRRAATSGSHGAARSSRSSSSSLAGGSFAKSSGVDDHVAGRAGHHAFARAFQRLPFGPGDVEQPLPRLAPRPPCRASHRP